ncbi:hypothetical protein IscW_ISCW016870, partial [Ixodes scapularis]
ASGRNFYFDIRTTNFKYLAKEAFQSVLPSNAQQSKRNKCLLHRVDITRMIPHRKTSQFTYAGNTLCLDNNRYPGDGFTLEKLIRLIWRLDWVVAYTPVTDTQQ